MAKNDRARRTKKALAAQRKEGSALPKGFTSKARKAAKNTSVPVESHTKRGLLGDKWAYQAKLKVRNSNGETNTYYSHVYGFDQANPPSRGEIQSRISNAEIDDPMYDEGEIEIESVEIVHSWSDDE